MGRHLGVFSCTLLMCVILSSMSRPPFIVNVELGGLSEQESSLRLPRFLVPCIPSAHPLCSGRSVSYYHSAGSLSGSNMEQCFRDPVERRYTSKQCIGSQKHSRQSFSRVMQYCSGSLQADVLYSLASKASLLSCGY